MDHSVRTIMFFINSTRGCLGQMGQFQQAACCWKTFGDLIHPYYYIDWRANMS